MAVSKRRETDPDMIRFNNLAQLCNAANNLIQDYAGDPEKSTYVQGVRDWAIQTLVDEYHDWPTTRKK